MKKRARNIKHEPQRHASDIVPDGTVISALGASDIATSLQLWVGHPQPNEHLFKAFL